MRILCLMMCVCLFVLPVSALEIEAPQVPSGAARRMPEENASLSDGFFQLIQNAARDLRPDLQEASRISLGIVGAVLLVGILQPLSNGTCKIADTAGAVAIAALLLGNSNALIGLASQTVVEIGEYGKLLLPVMTAALAAQGGVSGSAALCAGTAMFSALLQSIISTFLLPGIYLYLALQIGSSATGEELLKRIADLLKGVLVWCMKILLMVFTTYLGLTGVVSGSTDAAALKAAKVSMSTFVPVVGGALSDASEAVLVSAGLLKNTAGIYGIFAVLALFLHPFLKIGLHYLILRLTGAICTVFGSKPVAGLVEAFGTAMGLLLGMTASACVMVLISTVCFLKGAM